MFYYKDLLEEIQKFCDYGCETGVVGDSFLGNRIPYVFIGNDKKNCIIVQGAIHAREHITALLLVQLAKNLLANPTLMLNGGIYFVPMVNVDGVRIAQEGITWIKEEKIKRRLLEVNGNNDFSLWKANANCVDLNVNFDADWGKGRQNVFVPSAENYVGESVASEQETKALVRFTRALKPLATVSYHTKGEVIYWRFNQSGDRLWRDYRLAKGISETLNYPLAGTEGSCGGYKDWCISELQIPALTIEVGSDSYSHPLPYSLIPYLVRQNGDILRRLVNTLTRQKAKEHLKHN